MRARLPDIETRRDKAVTGTRPLRAVYATSQEADVVEGARPRAHREPVDRGTVDAARRVSRERDELGVVIDDFMQAAEAGEAVDAYGNQYTPEGLRELHNALSHVNSWLGTMQISAIQGWLIQGMLDQLRQSGLAPGRLTAVVEALDSLYTYAIRRGLVENSPVLWLTFPQQEDRMRAPATQRRPVVAEAPTEALAEAPTEAQPQAPVHASPDTPNSTNAMLALGSRVLVWTMRATITIFVLIAIVLIVGFA